MLVTGSGLDTIEAAVQHIPANALPHTNQPTAQLNAHSDAHAGKSAPIAHDSLTQFETIWMFMDDDGARRVWRHYGADLRIVRVVYLGEAFLRHSAVGLCRAHCSLHSALCLSLCARICACTEYCEHDGVALSEHDIVSLPASTRTATRSGPPRPPQRRRSAAATAATATKRTTKARAPRTAFAARTWAASS